MYLLTHERKTFKILCWSTSIVFFPLTGTTDYDVLWTVVSSSLLKFKVLSFHWNVTSNYFILIIQSQRYFLQEKNQEKLYYLSCGGKKNPILTPRIRTSLHYYKNLFLYVSTSAFVSPEVLLQSPAGEHCIWKKSKKKCDHTLNWSAALRYLISAHSLGGLSPHTGNLAAPRLSWGNCATLHTTCFRQDGRLQ